MHIMKRVWDKGSGLPRANTLELIDQYEARVTHPAQYEYIDTSCSLPPGSGRWVVVNDCSLPRTRPLINNQNVSRQVFYHSYLQRRWVRRWRTQMKQYPSKFTHTHRDTHLSLPLPHLPLTRYAAWPQMHYRNLRRVASTSLFISH